MTPTSMKDAKEAGGLLSMGGVQAAVEAVFERGECGLRKVASPGHSGFSRQGAKP